MNGHCIDTVKYGQTRIFGTCIHLNIKLLDRFFFLFETQFPKPVGIKAQVT